MYKTGKSVTLSFSGTCSGTISNSHVPTTGPYWLFGTQSASLSLNFGGAAVSCSCLCSPYVNPPAYPPPTDWVPPVSRQISVSANGDTQSYADGWFGGDNWGSPGTYPFDLTGSFSGSIDCEEVIDLPIEALAYDYDNGIFLPTPTAKARVYLVAKIGGLITASMSWMGLSASRTTTITSAYEVDPSLAVSGGANIGPNIPNPQNGSATFSANWTTSPAMSFPAQSTYGSSECATTSASLSSSSFALSASSDYSESNDDSVTPSIYTIKLPNSVAGVSATMWPSKSYSLTGQIFSVDQPYPESFPISFSKYNGDTDPHLSGPSLSASYSQQRYSYSVGSTSQTEVRKYRNGIDSQPYYDVTTDGSQGASDTLNQFQPISVHADIGWCTDNNQLAYYEVSDGINTVNRHLYNDLVPLRGWSCSALSLSLPTTYAVGDLTGWSNSKTVGSGIGNAAAGSMTRTFSPFYNMSGYRFLRLKNCKTTASHAQSRVLTINGKQWRVKFPTGTADVEIDLCQPTLAGGADHDTTDSMFPDTNPTLTETFGVGDGPLWGCTYVQSVSLSGFNTDSTESFEGVELFHKNKLIGNFATTWEPRWGAMPMWGPFWENDSGTAFERHNNRSMALITDGRQSMEVDGQSLLKISGASGVVVWVPTDYSITSTVARVNAGYCLDGTSGDPYTNYQTVSNGWHATDISPTPSGDGRVFNDFMNANLPTSWAYGDGAMYVGNGWQTGFGVNPAHVPVQVLMSQIDFYPSCGDIFGFGPGGTSSDTTIYLAAGKVYRSQVWGIVYDKQTLKPLKDKDLLLYPVTPPDIQDKTIPVGAGTSDKLGIFRDTGIGLDGINFVSAGFGGPDHTELFNTTGSQGLVQGITQTFHECRSVRVALGVKNVLSKFDLQGPQPSNVYTSISLPTGGGAPRLHMVVSRDQIIASDFAHWTTEFSRPPSTSTEASPFVATVSIPIKWVNTGIKYLSSMDFGRTWNVATDISAMAADSTLLNDGLSGTETWVVQFAGYMDAGILTITDKNLILPNYCDAWPHRPWKYKNPRVTTLQFAPDGSPYVNGVIGDIYQDTQGYLDLRTGETIDPPSDIEAAHLSDYQWKSGKRSINASGRSGWRDASTTNSDAGINALNPIWSSRGGGQANRGSDGTNGGPAQLLVLDGDGNLLTSDDCGDTWATTNKPGGQPTHSNLWFRAGCSTDLKDGNDAIPDDFRSDSELNDSLYRSQAWHPEQLVSVDADISANVLDALQVEILPQALQTMLPISRTEDKQYGVLRQRGWSIGQKTIIIISVVGGKFDTANAAQTKLQSSCQEIMIESTDQGKTWKFVGASVDGCQTWTNVNPLVATSGSVASVRDAVSGETYHVAV